MKTPLIATAILTLAASAAQAQSIQLNGQVPTHGCADNAFAVGVTTAGLSAASWRVHTTVDIGPARYTDDLEDLANPPDGDETVYLSDYNDTGTQTHHYPLPPNTPFTVTITLLTMSGQPVYRTQGTVTPGCDATGPQPAVTNITHTPLGSGSSGGSGTVAVPTLGHAALALLGAAVGGLGLRGRRRKPS